MVQIYFIKMINFIVYVTSRNFIIATYFSLNNFYLKINYLHYHTITFEVNIKFQV